MIDTETYRRSARRILARRGTTEDYRICDAYHAQEGSR